MLTANQIVKSVLFKAAPKKTRVRCPACGETVNDIVLHALEVLDKEHVVLSVMRA